MASLLLRDVRIVRPGEGIAGGALLLREGRIAPGAGADLVLWNDDLTPARTWREGICIHEETSP